LVEAELLLKVGLSRITGICQIIINRGFLDISGAIKALDRG